MKNFKLLTLLFVCIVSLSGCFAGTVSTSNEPLPSDDGAKEINIEVWDNTNFYIDAAQKFKDETGIKVNVINTYKSQDFNREDISINNERIQAELMAGKGADIYSGIGIQIDFKKIGENKHLCNLKNWITQDSSFSDDAYYMSILKSGFEKGNVYSVPLFMEFWALGSTIEAPELDGKSLNWEEFFELTKGIKRNGVLVDMTDYGMFKRRFIDKYDRFINNGNKTVNLDSSEMIKLLEQCKEWSEQGLCIPYNADNDTEMSKNAFFELPGGGVGLLTNIRLDNQIGDNYYLYDIPSDSGKNDKANKVSGTFPICVNAASQHKGTAWRFVKFLLSEDIQPIGLYNPINRKAFVASFKKEVAAWKENKQTNKDPDQIIKETEAILDSIDNVPDIYQTPSDIEGVVYKEAERYYKNEISAEEAAKNMSAGVTLYFKEQ